MSRRPSILASPEEQSEQVKAIKPGKGYWKSHKEKVWELLQCTDVDETGLATCTDESGAEVQAYAFELFAHDERVVDDMTSLYFIHEASILHNLEERAKLDNQRPYTYMASVLVAMNPLRRVADPDHKLYTSQPLSSCPPHPYGVAEVAFRQMTINPAQPVNQSIIVSGESGAGKTESSKILLRYMTERSKAAGGQMGNLDQRLLQSNIILETMGNAKTLRNNNSSRFGKYMKIQFDSENNFNLAGASIETYLLEKSRICFQIEGERNYHIFYQIANGASGDQRSGWKIGAAGDYNYINQSGCITIDGVDEPKMFDLLGKALASMGITDAESSSLYTGVAAVLQMGNIKFEDETTSAGDVAKVSNMDVMNTAAELFGIDAPDLEKCLREKTLVAAGRGSVYYVKRDSTQAGYARDAMSKMIYQSLFDWVVAKVRLALGFVNKPLPFIAVLDIFGFEHFQTNDFEQLLINFTNESLQGSFNRAVFISEQELYKEEGISVDAITPPDNSICLELIANKKTGILAILEQSGSMPQPSDEKFNEALHREHKDARCFPRPHPKDIATQFIVSHYAAEVTYTVGNFLDKNNDSIPPDVEALMCECKCHAVESTFNSWADEKKRKEEEEEKAASKGVRSRKRGKKKAQTVSGTFAKQISDLIERLNSTKMSYILCIKPNFAMQVGVFDRNSVMEQLQCTGTVQACEVLRVGLPTRVDYAEIAGGFKKVLPESTLAVVSTGVDDKFLVQGILFAFSVDSNAYALGRTKLFFKTGKIAVLESLMQKLNNAADSEQVDFLNKRLKFFVIRRRWRRAYAYVCAEKAWIWLFHIFRKQSAAAAIQRMFRCAMARATYKRLKEAETIRATAEGAAKTALGQAQAAASAAAAQVPAATGALSGAKASAATAESAVATAKGFADAAAAAGDSASAEAEIAKIAAEKEKAAAALTAVQGAVEACKAPLTAAQGEVATAEKAMAAAKKATEDVEAVARNAKGKETARRCVSDASEAHRQASESAKTIGDAQSELDKLAAEISKLVAQIESHSAAGASAAANKKAQEAAAADAAAAAAAQAEAERLAAEAKAAEEKAALEAAAEKAAKEKAAAEEADRAAKAAEEEAVRKAEEDAAAAKKAAEEEELRAKKEAEAKAAEEAAAEMRAMAEMEANEDAEYGEETETKADGGDGGARQGKAMDIHGGKKKAKKPKEPNQAEIERQQQEAEMAELREFWTILLRGLVVMKYATTGSKPQERVLWLDRSGARLYLDHRKRFDSKGNEKGLYLRDISQVRPGCNTVAFKKSSQHAPPADKCFSLIGTERTLDMEMPTAFVRERVVAKFNLLLKALSPVAPRKLTTDDASLMAHFQEVLIRGMEVVVHTSTTFASHKSTKNVLWLAQGARPDNGETAARLYLSSKKRKNSTGKEKGLWLDDMAECRPGINSDVFFKAPDNVTQSIANKCFSIIGSETTFDLEVKSPEARNAVVHRFQLWLQQIQKQAAQLGQHR